MILDWSQYIDEASFVRGGWVKEVVGVDDTQRGGYAFVGDFVNGATKGLSECKDGYYLVCTVGGSRKHPVKFVSLWKVSGDKVERKTGWAAGDDWALQLRVTVKEIIEQPKEDNPLAEYSTERLLAELRRRGVKEETLADLYDKE